MTLVLLAAAILAQAPSAADLAAQERRVEAEIKKTPTAELWQRLGLVRHLQNRFDQAIPAFEQAARLNPSLWTAHLFLGIDFYRTNQFERSLQSLERAEKLAPRDPAGREELDYWLGASRIVNRQPFRGLASLEGLLARNPKRIDALELAAQTYADLTTSIWNDVAEHQAETSQGYEIYGHALEQDANREAALDAYRQARTLDPARPGPRLAEARILLRSGKEAEALPLLEREAEISIDPEVSLLAGLAAIQVGRIPDAKRWLQSASEWPGTRADAAAALAALP